MVLGDTVSKLETFVRILKHISRFIAWSLFILKAPYLIKWPISTRSSCGGVSLLTFLKFETRPSFLLNFGTANFDFMYQGESNPPGLSKRLTPKLLSSENAKARWEAWSYLTKFVFWLRFTRVFAAWAVHHDPFVCLFICQRFSLLH